MVAPEIEARAKMDSATLVPNKVSATSDHWHTRSFAYTPQSNLCGAPELSLPISMQTHSRQCNDGLLQRAAQVERSIDRPACM